jgi:cation diffusion facilitator family transporter
MNQPLAVPLDLTHDHVFLGRGHRQNERKTWAVIVLCTTMMVLETIGGSLFGSLALVADGLHMSTHASAMLIAALAYRYARKHANDRRFVFGTGKLGDLAGFTSAVILAMIAVLIGYEAVMRFLSPVTIRFTEAIPIAILGLAVNVVSAWLLSGADHGHGHGHGHSHVSEGEEASHHDDARTMDTPRGAVVLSIFEEGTPPVFRILTDAYNEPLPANSIAVSTERGDGTRETFSFVQRAGYLESAQQVPEPHAFKVHLVLPDGRYTTEFFEHDHEVDARDNNMRAAYIHVVADAAVSVLAIIGLVLARSFGWLWMDPLAGFIGALVIGNWSYGLIRDTGAILVDLSPSDTLTNKVRTAVETAGDTLVDLHIWRLGPGHFGAVLSVVSRVAQRGPAFYHEILGRLTGLSHITVEVHTPTAG